MRDRNPESSIQLQSKRTCCRHVPSNGHIPPTKNTANKATPLVPSLSLGIVWSTVELGTAIICGCLPTYGPLLHDTNLPARIRACFTSSSARGPTSSTKPATGQHLSSRNTYGDSSVTGHYQKFNDDTLSDDVRLSDLDGGGRCWTTEMARINQDGTPLGGESRRGEEVV